MEQFSLEKWLQDKSRKIVTRRGNPVRIICTDRKYGEDELPIVFLEECLNGEFLLACTKDGRGDYHYDSQYDLFFADEEEKLTKFEKTMIQFSHERNSLIQFEHTKEEINAHLYLYSKKLLDLARKEICLTCKEYSRGYQEGLKLGREDALKDLPKWKKAPSHEKQTMYGMSEISDVYYNGYFIHLDDIYKALPKE